MSAADEARFLSVAQAAALVGLCERTVRRLVASGEIPSIRVGGSIRIPVRWRDKLLAACEGVKDDPTDASEAGGSPA